MQARSMLLPIIQAEDDLNFLRRLQRSKMLEEQVMKDVEAWRVGESVYHGDQFVPPTFLLTK